MATLRVIRKRIRSVISTRQITNAMKMVAVARLRKAQTQAEQSRPYAERMTEMLQALSAAASEQLSHPYFERRRVKKQTLVLVTSDRGLCGAFNSNLIRRAQTWLEERTPEQVELLCVGRRGYRHFRRRPWPITGAYNEFNGRLNFPMVRSLVAELTNRFLTGQTDEIYVLFTKFHSLARVTVTLEKYLNIDRPETAGRAAGNFIFEPDPDTVFADLLPRYAMMRLQAALADSFASEQATRMLAMTMATDNADEMIDALTLQFNKARQAAITKEILEVVGGAEAQTA
jgi:F-type H+-transporting ATPase subunit gamma